MTVSYGLFKSRFKKTIANAIYNEVITKSARYYHFLGKENTWTDFLSPFIPSQDPAVGDIPGAPSDNFRYELHVRRDILSTKLITPSDVSYIVPRVDWTFGEVYDMYDDALSPEDPAPSGAVRLEDARFYVLTQEYNVYKCLDNNYNAVSTVKPTGTGTDPFITADGYMWKFMYTIPLSLRNRFLSSTYMPVTTALKNQYYADGEIIEVMIEDGGSGYTNPIITVSGANGYLKDNPYVIDTLVIDEPGFGYSTVPTVTIADPTVISGSESTATAEVTIDGAGSVDNVTLLSAGYGYTADPVDPVITVSEPVTGAIAYVINSAITGGTTIVYNNNYYYAVNSGTANADYPTHTSGTVTFGDVDLQYIATRATIAPVMVKTDALLEAVLSPTGEIVGITITDGGTGYTEATISVSDPTGSGAELIPLFSIGNINTLQATVEQLAIEGAIYSMKVVDGGVGYSNASITVLGDGVGCTAEAVVYGGRVVKINITNPGYGYTWTDILVNGDGGGAIVRAIMSPINGHGFNAVDELNANSIMFFSSWSRDVNHGMVVSNDYRKAGLLRNITNFSNGNRFKEDVGTGCVLITGEFDVTKLAQDMLLVQATGGYQAYRIVEYDATRILVSVFNNFPINPGDTLVTPDGYLIQVDTVAERTIDQFSGDFLFLTVREPFAPSEEQIITVRTVLTI